MNPNLFPQSSEPSQTSPSSSPQFPDNTTDKTHTDSAASGLLEKLEHLVSARLTKPAMSTNSKDMLAEYFPWLALISGFIMFPIVMTGILGSGLLSVLTSIGTPNTNPAYWVGLVLFTIQFVLIALSVMKLLSHRQAGWQLVFIASCLGLLTAICNIFADFINPLVTTPLLVVISIVSLYLLAQVRSYYSE